MCQVWLPLSPLSNNDILPAASVVAVAAAVLLRLMPFSAAVVAGTSNRVQSTLLNKLQ